MDDCVLKAVEILNQAYDEVAPHPRSAALILYRAIRHLSMPERDVYPKTRKGTKSKPILRRSRTSSVDLL